MKVLFNEDSWVEEFSNLMSIGEVWKFFETAVKPAANEVLLTKPGREKDSMPVPVNDYLKKNVKNNRQATKNKRERTDLR